MAITAKAGRTSPAVFLRVPERSAKNGLGWLAEAITGRSGKLERLTARDHQDVQNGTYEHRERHRIPHSRFTSLQSFHGPPRLTTSYWSPEFPQLPGVTN